MFATQDRSEHDLSIQECEGGLGFQRFATDTSSRVTILQLRKSAVLSDSGHACKCNFHSLTKQYQYSYKSGRARLCSYTWRMVILPLHLVVGNSKLAEQALQLQILIISIPNSFHFSPRRKIYQIHQEFPYDRVIRMYRK